MSRVGTMDRTRLLEELLEIGIALSSERDLHTLLERILESARRLTRAEAGTLFLREGDYLRFAVAQNDFLEAKLGQREAQRRLQDAPLSLAEPSLAGHVARTGEVINVADAYAIGVRQTLAFNRTVDATNDYSTRSVFVAPLHDPTGGIVGVLELINALDENNAIIPFDPDDEKPLRALASQAAVAIRTARLEDLSFKDGLTDLYNRRYFALRIDEEVKRCARFGHPLSLVFLDLDDFRSWNEAKGHTAGDETLREVARLLVKHSRSFTIITRREGDGFGAILANTPKAGALSYAQRIRAVLEGHPFVHGAVTASFGVASLPADATSASDLIAAAERAMTEAKLQGRNRVATL